VYPSSGIEVDVTDHEAVEAMGARVIDFGKFARPP
jgi:hypothetical protein